MNTVDSKLSSVIEQIVDVFTTDKNITKMEFLNKVFSSSFDLIPEAEKGSYFELIDEYYYPLMSKGYDYKTLTKLKFHQEQSFVDYKLLGIQQIDAYAMRVETRSKKEFSKDMIETFKELGTYEPFHTAYAPILVENKVFGIICLDNFSGVPFSDLSKKILKFYAQMISNFYSLIVAKEKESQANKEIILALISAIEIKDSYTGGHGSRVRNLSQKIASKFNMSPTEIHEIATAALLHDVGKIGISTKILNKPGKLTDKEFGVIKEHPSYTKKILENITNFSNIVEYAYCHHEYYNGKGYPRGLKGDEIPFGSQIIMICDVFDALTDDRPYRKAFDFDKAISIIREESGRMFDPRVVEVAIKVFEENK